MDKRLQPARRSGCNSVTGVTDRGAMHDGAALATRMREVIAAVGLRRLAALWSASEVRGKGEKFIPLARVICPRIVSR
jgi:hypothetical protein